MLDARAQVASFNAASTGGNSGSCSRSTVFTSATRAVLKNLLRPFLSAAIMGAVVYGAYRGLTALGLTSRLMLCALPVCLGVCVYAFAAVKLRAITKADCLLLPKGAKIAKLLKL